MGVLSPAGAEDVKISLFGQHWTAARDDVPRLHELRHARNFALLELHGLDGAIYG